MEFLTWPLVVLIIALIFLFLFRKDISLFIHRIKKVDIRGIRASAEQNAENISEKVKTADEILSFIDNKLVTE